MDHLDVVTMSETALMIVGELHLDRLLPRLMQRMIEHAGATNGALIFDTAGTLVVEAECRLDDDEACRRPACPVDTHPTISQAVVNYVWHTREKVVLENASLDPIFGADTSIRQQQVRSLLCLPIIRQHTLIGLLYLENPLTSSVFTDDRVQVLEVLASTTAIALENARAYQARQQAEAALKATLNEVQALKDLLEEEKSVLQEEITWHHNFHNILGTARSLKYALQRVEDVAPLDTIVLIEGETGTGKELVARAIHAASPRSAHPLVKINCAAIPATLLESELFGHEKGAFTGAEKTKKGRFELAHGGTLFLDEIGELPLDLQAKLLTVLEDHAFERLGGEHTITVDVRVIVATNRVLKNEVAHGRFRDDLYHRVNVYPISLPPLRQRRNDIPLLVQKFVHEFAKKLGKEIEIPQRVMTSLQAYSWPGNVRELRNVIERAVIITKGAKLRLAETLEVSDSAHDSSGKESSQYQSLHEVERQHILQVLQACHWKISGENGAADILDIHPNTLRNRMQKLGIKRPV
jgi:chemotaxis protein methyltransferase CheR